MLDALNRILAAIPPAKDMLDLQAQMDMAKWAYWMLVVSIVSTIAGTVGVGGLIYSIRQTRLALQQAALANALTEKSLLIDTRPWLLVHDVQDLKISVFEEADGSGFLVYTEMKLSMKNVGKTPARGVDQNVRLRAINGTTPLKEHAPRPYFDLAPGEIITHKVMTSTIFPKDNPDSDRMLVLEVALNYDRDLSLKFEHSTIWYSYLGVFGEPTALIKHLTPTIDAEMTLDDPRHQTII